jgi:6-pyruvoyl-tetrahydropterin synthase
MFHYNSITVKHNMEVAHRLFLQPGKCQNIHGHSMQVQLTLYGNVNEEGIFGGVDFSHLKKLFRAYIDGIYDHHLLLNMSDPWARALYTIPREKFEDSAELVDFITTPAAQSFLPGVQAFPGDPTTENLSRWIAEDMVKNLFPPRPANAAPEEPDERFWPFPNLELEALEVEITETGTNGATHFISAGDMTVTP